MAALAGDDPVGWSFVCTGPEVVPLDLGKGDDWEFSLGVPPDKSEDSVKYSYPWLPRRFHAH